MGNKTWMGVVKLHPIWAYIYNSSNWLVLKPLIIYNCGSRLSFYKKIKLVVYSSRFELNNSTVKSGSTYSIREISD